jgi:hypothetical protein
MAGLALIVIILVLVSRRRGGSISLSPLFWVRVGKCVELFILLVLFGMTDLFGGILLAPAFILLFTPSFVLKLTVVPLGLPRVAYWMARWCRPLELVKETAAGAVLYGALALARKPSSTQTIGWLEQRANRAQPLRGAGVVAAGLLAALRGDGNRARCLFLIADTLARKFIPRSARVIARDWLVADAARIGNWREVIRLGRRGRHSLRWSYTVARIGERLNGDPKACQDWRLWLCWVVAPRRRATLPLLRRALAVSRAPMHTAVEPSAPAELPDALANLGQVLERSFAIGSQSLVRSVRGVDTALDHSTTRTLVRQRLLALGAQHDAETIISGFRTRLVDLLAPIIEESPDLIGGQERSPILDQAIERVRIRLFGDIEAQCKDYGERQKRQSSLNALAEWETWAVMRDRANRLLELVPGSEHALFHTMLVPVCNFAVFQHNTYRRLTLAHEIYFWLRLHSQSDPSASQLLLKNMKASEA